MTHFSSSDLSPPPRYAVLVGFIALVVGVGLTLGFLTRPDLWYQNLAKPPFNPPNWIFGPVWTALYLMIAVAGWRIWARAPRSGAMLLWVVQMLLNWAWSPVFFALHSLNLALVIIVALLATILAFIAAARRHDEMASWLFVPYAAWVGFATLLNGWIAVVN